MRNLRYMADKYEGNGQADMASYFRSGHSIVALKASEGAGHRDSLHASRSKWAHGEGGTVLHYHFARPDENKAPEIEAQWYLGVVKQLWVPGDYLCLDVERGLDRPVAYLDHWVMAFSTYCANHFGAHPVIYASESVFNGQLRNVRIPGNRAWVAKYGAGIPSLARPWREWAWQFTDGVEGKQPHTAVGMGATDQSLLPLWVALPLWARTRRRRWMHSRRPR